MKLELHSDFTEEQIAYLNSLSNDELNDILNGCVMEEAKRNTNQQVRKILINSLYGALGNEKFRLYSLVNAAAVTSFGQLAIQWVERKVNEYLNGVCGTTDHKFVCYIDTDSIYVDVEKVVEKIGIHIFRDTNHLVDFLDKFGRDKMEPVIEAGYQELREYMNNKEHLMFMDREAIAVAPMNTDGCGGFWTGKKRYALNVYDMEGTRYSEPHLKIMGLETQRSSTPEAIRGSLKECIRIMLQEGETPLQAYVKQFKSEMKEMDYRRVASVSSANGLSKWSDGHGFPNKGTPKHVKGVLLHNRLAAQHGFNRVIEGSKVMVLPLKDGNKFNENAFSWASGEPLPEPVVHDVLAAVDWVQLTSKTFDAPLDSMCQSAKMDYEKKATLFDMFDF